MPALCTTGATDAARAAADIVLTQPGLSVVITAIEVARCIFGRVKSFITYRIAATLQLLCFFFIAVFCFDPSATFCAAAAAKGLTNRCPGGRGVYAALLPLRAPCTPILHCVD